MAKLSATQLKLLPKAAQNYIAALEATVSRLDNEAHIQQDEPDPAIFYHVGIGSPRGIPGDCVVSFRLRDGRLDIYASEDRESLSVRGYGLDQRAAVSLSPNTANTFTVAFKKG